MEPPDRASGFREYRRRLEPVLRELAAGFGPSELDEQAAPSYVAGLALSRAVFWSRLARVMRVLGPRPGRTALDFGCGTGVMLPWLCERCEQVLAVEIFRPPLDRFLDLWAGRHAPLGRVAVFGELDEAMAAHGPVDLILALDSLEHVPNLEATLAGLATALAPGGRIVISGPTENRVYRLGRALVGFSGEYHHRTIYDIETAAARLFGMRRVGRILYPLTLFLILEGRR